VRLARVHFLQAALALLMPVAVHAFGFGGLCLHAVLQSLLVTAVAHAWRPLRVVPRFDLRVALQLSSPGPLRRRLPPGRRRRLRPADPAPPGRRGDGRVLRSRGSRARRAGGRPGRRGHLRVPAHELCPGPGPRPGGPGADGPGRGCFVGRGGLAPRRHRVVRGAARDRAVLPALRGVRARRALVTRRRCAVELHADRSVSLEPEGLAQPGALHRRAARHSLDVPLGAGRPRRPARGRRPRERLRGRASSARSRSSSPCAAPRLPGGGAAA
jgi:hypothetical protein